MDFPQQSKEKSSINMFQKRTKNLLMKLELAKTGNASSVNTSEGIEVQNGPHMGKNIILI